MADVLSKLGDLKAHIEESLSFWKVPGVAVSLVKDGEMVLAEGYGYKDLENKKEVTPKHSYADRLRKQVLYGNGLRHIGRRRQDGLG
jgi:hypothetical protein